MKSEDRIKLFAMSHALVERDLDNVEENHRIDLERSEADDRDEEYYPQFDAALRTEASEMGRHYELFHCLETNISLRAKPSGKQEKRLPLNDGFDQSCCCEYDSACICPGRSIAEVGDGVMVQANCP